MEEFKPVVLVPTYNEALNIKSFIEEVFRVCPDINLLIIDDASPDGTADIAHNLLDKRVFILKRNKKTGLKDAYIAGIKHAEALGFNAFIQMDADFSHKPCYLPTMLENLKKYDFVIGSRNVKGGGTENWGFSRILISKLGSLYSRIVLSCPIKDLTGGFNGWRKSVFDKIGVENLKSKGFGYIIELKYRAFKAGFNFVEFPIIFPDRKFGKSKMSKEIFFEAAKNVIKIRFSK